MSHFTAAGVSCIMNAELNKVPIDRLRISVDNLIGSGSVEEDIIFIGDMFYDEEFAVELLPWLTRLHQEGKEIYVGDPGRHGLTAGRLNFMEKMATYELTENCCIENRGFKFVNVWRFRSKE